MSHAAHCGGNASHTIHARCGLLLAHEARGICLRAFASHSPAYHLAVLRVISICSRNRLRSPTAERVFATWPGVETDSPGLAPDAVCPLKAEQAEWAEVIFVMEKQHRSKLAQRFKGPLKGKRVVCLDVPDDYEYMQAELVALLEKRAPLHLCSLRRQRSGSLLSQNVTTKGCMAAHLHKTQKSFRGKENASVAKRLSRESRQ